MAALGRTLILNPLRWLGRRKIELSVFLVGVFLRLTMVWRYHATWAYDFQWHWEMVEWIKVHHRTPPVEAVFQAQHPPLFYASAAWLYGNGVSRDDLVWLPLACGTIRLALIWAGLELYLPHSRWARVSALALAAVIAASVHIDGMIYPEAMSCMLVTLAMFLVPLTFRRRLPQRFALTAAVGLVLGLGMLTKVSSVTIIAAVGSVAALEFFLSTVGWKARALHLLSWSVTLAVCVAVCGWYYARNVRDYGRPFVTSFDLPSQHWLIAAKDEVRYFDRRPLGFILNWDRSIYEFPYYPSACREHPSFFPVAVASTFVDYWNYGFSGVPPTAPTGIIAGARPITRSVLFASQGAAVGGTAIAIGALAAFFASARRAFEIRNWGWLFLLLVPLFTVLAAVHFAIAYPVDSYGVVKGVYMQFGAPPMYALYGLSVAWARRKAPRWPLLAALLAALGLVAWYTIVCRFGV